MKRSILMPMSEDDSNGYEGIASIYVAGRGTRPLVGDAIGAATVRAWAQAFPPDATVLDLGSGPGEPSTRILREAGLAIYAVDASSAMVAAFRERFPSVPIEQNTVEASEFFDRTFDGVLAWGLLFLLKPAGQALVIEKVARALNPGGRFLFTAPKEPLEWLDAMTGRQSQSLGAQTYERLLRDAGLTSVAEAEDEGENHYYFVEKRQPSRGLKGRPKYRWEAGDGDRGTTNLTTTTTSCCQQTLALATSAWRQWSSRHRRSKPLQADGRIGRSAPPRARK
jgi:SAM-dependent methyltransferase